MRRKHLIDCAMINYLSCLNFKMFALSLDDYLYNIYSRLEMHDGEGGALWTNEGK